MSRIDEALKRARAGADDGRMPDVAAPSANAESDQAPSSASPFQAPWAFPEGEGKTTTTPSPQVEHQTTPAPGSPDVWETLLASPNPSPIGSGEGASACAPAETPGMVLFQGLNPSVVEKVVSTPQIRPIFAEQYRKLAGVLHHAQLERNLKVVVITSALAGEGKTLTSTNLALTFSESFRRSVLLVDADLRRPTLHEIFQVPNVVGLGDGLRADKEQKLSLVQVSPKLTLLTAGRPDPDPMSGLSSDRMRRVIEEATARFDWVIIDTPPVGLLPDAKILAQMADTALLVIDAGRTPYPLVQRAVNAIGRDRILGVVLNRTEDGLDGSYGYYTYYDGYGKKDGR
jgi:protein-tyrosine kinase